VVCNLKFIILYIFVSISLFANNIKKIPILISSDSLIYDQTIYGIQTVLDQELEISYLEDVVYSEEKLSNYIQKIELSESPIVITIGNLSTKLILEKVKSKTILFSMVSSPKVFFIDSDRLCGVSLDVPLKLFFETIKEFNMNNKHVVTFYSSKEGEYLIKEGESIDLINKLIYNPIKIENRDELSQELNQINKIDAFVMIYDPIYGSKEFVELSNHFKNKKILFASPFPSLVKLGASFGIFPNYTKIGIQTGEMARRLISNSTSCKQEFIQTPDQFSFMLNEDYAFQSGITIPHELKERAKLSGLIELGLQLMNEKKVKSAKVVFDRILEADSNNKIALYYQQLLLDAITGDTLKELFNNADFLLKGGKYPQAKEEYQKILKINPNQSKAKEGINQCVLLMSEKERIQAINFFNSGDSFTAIAKLENSIKILPTNSQAKKDLEKIREIESPKIKKYIQTGIKDYNSRNYESAIKIFKESLLVLPGDKLTLEYLRLSLKKKESLESLRKKNIELYEK
jgi:ABC-type uncharacterized transport system substrate-binding protein